MLRSDRRSRLEAWTTCSVSAAILREAPLALLQDDVRVTRLVAPRCTLAVLMRASSPRRSRLMSPRPDLGPKPRLGYAHSRIERAAERRRDTTAFEQDPQARS